MDSFTTVVPEKDDVSSYKVPWVLDNADYDQEELFLEHPSTDIRTDLQHILNTRIDFKGSYFFNKTYDNAPNPALRLNNLGHVGLPLSIREAREIISHCTKAPFGKGEKTIIDKSVRDTWEMDASKLHFDNPAWQGYMKDVVHEVCEQLGVNFSFSKPRLEAYKLLLYETGSHFLPHQDTEKVKGMFATIVIVLPSQFAGGSVHLSHGCDSVVLNCSPDSLYNTSALAWYSDVMHEIKPITSGFRLAISYNLIHTSNSLKPSLPSSHTLVDQLRHVLLSWKQARPPTPIKIIYLLEHKYSQANLRGDALKGADAHKVGLLQDLARTTGFRMGLANVECHVNGDGNDYGGGYGSDCNVSIGDVEYRNISIQNLVDLEGRLIKEEIDCEDDCEHIPEDLSDIVESGQSDEREYEGYQGNHAGSVDLYYRRTALVIWPDSHNPDIEYGDDFTKPIGIIASTESSKPNKEEYILTRFLLRVASGYNSSHDILRGLCVAACRWKDVQLWHQAMNIGKGLQEISVLGVDGYVQAIASFGFQNTQQSLETVLRSDPSNGARISLLDAISIRIDEGQCAAISAWLPGMRVNVVNSLKEPKLGEEKILIDLAQGRGVSFFASSILSQVASLAKSPFLLSFANYLHKEKDVLTQSLDDKAMVERIITDLLSWAVLKADFFMPVAVKPSAYSQRSQPPISSDPSAELAYSCIETCLTTRNIGLIDSVVDRLTSMFDPGTHVALERTVGVLLPLTSLLVASDCDTNIPGLGKLGYFSVSTYMNDLSQWIPTGEEIAWILDAVILARDAELLWKTVLQAFKSPVPTEALSGAFVQGLQLRAAKMDFLGDSVSSVTAIVTELVEDLILRADYGSNPSVLISLFEICFETNNSPVAVKLCARIILSPASQNTADALLPLLPDVRLLLAKWNIGLTTEPFDILFKRVMELYVEKLLVPKPQDASALLQTIRGNKCSCVECRKVVAFLTKSIDRELDLHCIGAPKRKHVEANLMQHGGLQSANWRTISTSPQGLQISKETLIYLHVKWIADRDKAIAALNGITKDEGVRRIIFGADYLQFMACLHGTSTSGSTTFLSIRNQASPSAITGRSSTAGQAPPAQDTQRPSKKRRSNLSESIAVIDLCSP